MTQLSRTGTLEKLREMKAAIAPESFHVTVTHYRAEDVRDLCAKCGVPWDDSRACLTALEQRCPVELAACVISVRHVEHAR